MDLVETIDQFHLTFTSTWTLFYGIDTIDIFFFQRLVAGSNPARPTIRRLVISYLVHKGRGLGSARKLGKVLW